MFKETTFIKSITNITDSPQDELPRYLLMGRSNVGKSTFINSLTNRKNIARTSGTPGKTITLNFYNVDNEFYLVDAPGYGYARRSKKMQAEFVEIIDNYIINEPTLLKVFQLIDFKVGPTQDDLEVNEYLNVQQLDVIVVCTKYDKVSPSHRMKQEKLIRQAMNTDSVYFTSSLLKTGFDKIKKEFYGE